MVVTETTISLLTDEPYDHLDDTGKAVTQPSHLRKAIFFPSVAPPSALSPYLLKNLIEFRAAILNQSSITLLECRNNFDMLKLPPP